MVNCLLRLVFSKAYDAILGATISLIASGVNAHEFWLEPASFQVAMNERVEVDLRNGQMFKGARLPYFDHRILRFETANAAGVAPYSGRMGDLPAFSMQVPQPGLLTVIHETQPEELTYDTWKAFEVFAQEKDLKGLLAQHLQRGLPRTGFRESYSRHAKLLLAVGQGLGADKPRGMKIELVALQNPYQMQGNTLPVLLLHQGRPLSDVQVEVFERSRDHAVEIRLLRTDSQGQVLVDLTPERIYLLNAVLIRPEEQSNGTVWHSLWASLVFAHP